MNQENGFTLVETMVTVAIVGVITLVAVPQYQTHLAKGQAAEAFALMEGAKADVIEAIVKSKSCTPATGATIQGKYGTLTITGAVSADALLHPKALLPTGCTFSYKLKNSDVSKQISNKLIVAQLFNNGVLSKDLSTSVDSKYLPKQFTPLTPDGVPPAPTPTPPPPPVTPPTPPVTPPVTPPPPPVTPPTPPVTPPTPPVTPPPPPVTPPAPSPTGTEVPITLTANSYRQISRSKVPGDLRVVQEYSLPGVMLRIGNRPNDLNGGPDIGYDYGITLQYPKGVDPTKIEGVDVSIKFQSGQSFNFSLRGFEVPADGYNYLDSKYLALFSSQAIFSSLSYQVIASSECADIRVAGRCYQDVLLQDKLNKNYIVPALNPLAYFVEGVLTADVSEIDPDKGFVMVTTLPTSKGIATTKLTYHMKK